MDAYRALLARRLDPAAAFLQKVSGAVQGRSKKRIVFAEGEETPVIRAAYAFQSQGLGHAILLGREQPILENMRLAADQPGPQLLRRRDGGARPRRWDGHGRDPVLRPVAGRDPAGDRPGARR